MRNLEKIPYTFCKNKLYKKNEAEIDKKYEQTIRIF